MAVSLDDDAISLTGFVTPIGHFNFHRMPFGMRNSGCTYQRLMAKVLQDTHKFARFYLDDTMVFGISWTEHLEHLRIVFLRVKNAGIRLNERKFKYGSATVIFLGHRVGLSKVQPGELKVKALTDFKRPSCRKQMHSFVGLASYFCKFIPTYAYITAALSDMMKKCNEIYLV